MLHMFLLKTYSKAYLYLQLLIFAPGMFLMYGNQHIDINSFQTRLSQMHLGPPYGQGRGMAPHNMRILLLDSL